MGFDFEGIWKKYPRPIGKKKALRHFLSTVKTEKDLQDIQKALENYMGSDTVKQGFVQNGSTWFNNWQDYIDFADVQRKKVIPLKPREPDVEIDDADRADILKMIEAAKTKVAK